MVRDPAWDAFVQELRSSMAIRGVTAGALAKRLGIAEEDVRNWRRGRTHPRLAQLPAIAAALQMGVEGEPGEPADPLFLPRRMGIVGAPASEAALFDTAFRLQKLELKLAQATDRAGALGRSDGAASVVRAAVGTGAWSVAVWPAVEGLRDCRLHVADRLDIARTDGRATSTEEVWRDPVMKAALRAAYAVPASRSPRWSEDDAVSHWAISHVGSPRSPYVGAPWPGLSSVACLALTVDSWVSDVASLIALSLGFGLTTTRDLAMEVYGLTAGATLPEQRRQAHGHLLNQPPDCRVWSHHAPLDGSNPFESELDPQPSDGLHFVWFRESDRVFKRWLERGHAGTTLSDLQRDRARVDALLETAGKSHSTLVIDVDYSRNAEHMWSQVLDATHRSLTHFVRQGLLDDPREIHQLVRRAEPDIAVPLFDWLTSRRCPAFVY